MIVHIPDVIFDSTNIQDPIIRDCWILVIRCTEVVHYIAYMVRTMGFPLGSCPVPQLPFCFYDLF
jgi:hypothetical protein